MLAKVMSVGISGIDGFPVTVEVDKSGGMPGFDIVGLPDASVKESRERVKSALRNSHLEYPLGHFTINLAPADLRKEGPSFDLPIAVGVLLLDELPEYPRPVLESLRQPLEDGSITISRAHAQAVYPARLMLVCSMNPCPCGFYGSQLHQCRCTASEIRRYRNKVSGPLLDRIDIQIEVESVPINQISMRRPEESSETILKRVTAARNIQLERYANDGITCNAQLNARLREKYCQLDDDTRSLLESAAEMMHLSSRGYTRVLKVARTIADLDGGGDIRMEHVAEAVQYRSLDGKYWNA